MTSQVNALIARMLFCCDSLPGGAVLADREDCTAVFAANDQMALGLLRALHECGRRVPEKVSVIGFDDIPEAGDFLPPLTTLHQDFAEVGRFCVENVLRKMRRAGTVRGARVTRFLFGMRAEPAPAASGTA